ncbi:calmodulin-binding receptor-like cytoplasmic kinase 2 isoform X1 [Actinidia eriantha]|uniref:calmodulin-binding receptor-like cytoplasmic kinase 2 isoform X1 n=1 Tax=Actinidia eriantha TaxID=165200 RepID=UPI00258672F3|nr:calmodulin-binding receptor-like cytoplasmic kinase 2 isoform X1 [Actinidia eriantha]
MRNRESPYEGRSSGNLRTPDRYAPSPGSGYWSSSSSQKSTSSRNPVRIAARSVAGAFIACFTPPETKKLGDYEEFKAPSVVSDASVERKRGSSRGIYATSNDSTRTREPGSVKFTMTEIVKATRNFSPTFKIGQGGFGTVYKGRLEDGTLVAIKRAKKSVYDKHLGVEFQSEIRTLAQIEHLNLVKFYGYLEHEDERIVVVEYVPNGTLREHLDCMHGNILDFTARLDISIDVAHAVTYLHMYTGLFYVEMGKCKFLSLHYHPIIHRDIKSSNILLTEKLRAKVADFGFARMAADSASGATHVSTQVKGTAGYLDPEYLRTYQLTEKSDVYSFGVLLVELVTGRRPIEAKRELKERITTRWAIKKFTDGEAIMILDPRLDRSVANNLALEKILELALKCLANQRQSRPTMKRCAEILWSIRKDYRELSASDTLSLSSHSRSGSVREQ